MALRLVQFLAIMLTALALVPPHLLCIYVRPVSIMSIMGMAR